MIELKDKDIITIIVLFSMFKKLSGNIKEYKKDPEMKTTMCNENRSGLNTD